MELLYNTNSFVTIFEYFNKGLNKFNIIKWFKARGGSKIMYLLYTKWCIIRRIKFYNHKNIEIDVYYFLEIPFSKKTTPCSGFLIWYEEKYFG